MKKIEYRIIDCFPKLAWVAVVDEKQNSITAYHGKYVECRSDWMIEGIWNGSFQEGNFHETALVFGTGVRIAEDKIYFVSSGSMADRLYYAFSGGKFLVSNSLPCLVALTDLDLDPVKDYAEFFQSLKKGFGKYEKELTARDQRGKIMNVLGENLVYQSGTVDVEKKPNIQKSCFSDFKSLKTFLRESFRLLQNNWVHPSRQHGLQTFSTLSTGYDSAAVSFFASQAGCRDFFSCVSSNALGPKFFRTKKKITDDGSHLAGHMGKTCIRFDRGDFKKDLSNELYLFPGMPNTRLTNFLPMINQLDKQGEPSILFTGIGGDYAWGSDPVDNDYDFGAVSLSEIRLKAGFIHCPFLSWLSQFRPLLLQINRSEEMKQWSIRSFYDRTIPRRILEEEGFSRESFGYIKKGGWNWFRVPNRPFDSQLRRQYYRFLVTNHLCSRREVACFPIISVLYWMLHFLKAALWKLGGSRGRFAGVSRPFAGIAHSTFPWAVTVIADGYRVKLRQDGLQYSVKTQY